MGRSNRATHARRVDRERREQTLHADVSTFSDNMLSGAIYQMQHLINWRAERLYGEVDETKRARLSELVAEQNRRHANKKED